MSSLPPMLALYWIWKELEYCVRAPIGPAANCLLVNDFPVRRLSRPMLAWLAAR